MNDQEISNTEQLTNNSTTDMIQLIYFDLSYNENFEQQIQKTNFASLGKDYNTVAIIGCQSSGKSTLLNNLFQTNFEVMSDDKGRGQTTKGIWTSLCIRNKILILDCEGTDSKERGDDRHKFENCSSLFALAIADLLLVNMWTVDIGRYTASNYGVLKTVFEMNLKLFQQECAKKILFVLRDFNPESDNKEEIQKLILNDVYKIWAEVKKPEKYKDYEPHKFFEFEFFTIPHYFYNNNGFNEQVGILRSRFTKENDNYLFSHSSQDKNVLAQDLNLYCSKIWTTILNDKDLNIPNEKEMLARFKCNEIKNASLSAVEPKINDFVNESDNIEILSNDFVASTKAILKEALESYSLSAKFYLHHIYESVKTELTENIASKLYVSFGNQAKKFIPKSQKEMRTELEETVNKDDNFNKCSQNIKKKYLENLVNKLEKIKVFDSWEITVNEYEELFNEIIDNQRRVCIQEKKTETIKKLRRLIEDYIFVRIEDLTPNFWDDFNQEYFTMTYNMLFSLEAFFIEYYGMANEEFKDIMVNIENEVYSSAKKDFLKKVMDLHLIAYDNFRKSFWYNEGVPRVWNKMEEQEITHLKEKYLKENEFIFNMFAQFKVLRNPLKNINYEKKSDAEFNESLKTIPDLLKEESNYEELLSKNESSDLKTRYINRVSELYEDASRRHANIVQQTMPVWVWILIFYVGYEDIIRMFRGYWYIPVILAMSIYGTLKATGTTHIPGQIVNIIKNFIKLQTGPFK